VAEEPGQPARAIVPPESGDPGIGRVLAREQGDVGRAGHRGEHRGHDLEPARVAQRGQLGDVAGFDGGVQCLRRESIRYKNDY
jgi:hypothetical protein